MFVIIAYGYTKTDRKHAMKSARKKTAIPIKTPIIAKRIFMAMNHMIPSISRVKISPGARILQVAMSKNTSPTKLLLSITQEINVNIVIARKIPADFAYVVPRRSQTLKIIIKVITLARGPNIKDRLRRLCALSRVRMRSLSSFSA